MFKKLESYNPIIRKTLALAYPITIGQFGLVLMGFCDTVMLGRVGTSEMGAASVGNAIYFLFMLIGVGLMYAISTLASIKVGENKAEQSVPLFISSLKMSTWFSLVLFIINLILVENFHLFKQSPTVTKLGAEYLWIVNFSVPAMMFYNCGKQILDGISQTKISMYVTYFGVALNVLLNYLMIFGHWGFEPMGLKGAAWATVISRFAMAIIMLFWAWYHPMMKEFRLKKYLNVDYQIEILKIGLPIGFTFFFEMGAFTAALIMTGWINEVYLAAHQIAINIASLTYMFITGIAAAGNIIVGNYYGLRDKLMIRKAGFAALILSVVFELVFMFIFILFSEQIALLYNTDVKVVESAKYLIFLADFFQLADGIQAVSAGILRGIKDTFYTGIVAFISYWVIMVPGAYISCFHFNMGINGIWFFIIFGLTFASIILFFRFFKQSLYSNIKFDD